MDYDQSVKSDNKKPKISLVPTAIIYDIAKIREYGVNKYGDPENWKKVEIERYWDAFLRHTLACFGNLKKKDEESGFPHLYHAACNLAFILELLEENDKRQKCENCQYWDDCFELCWNRNSDENLNLTDKKFVCKWHEYKESDVSEDTGKTFVPT